mmetsp:Transcript_33955/g.109452  ORF Transcript_33955/g.109452 Transcript_33955/m.109452 type:complete len:204 (+) Transcript_33955:538-1149(+)
MGSRRCSERTSTRKTSLASAPATRSTTRKTPLASAPARRLSTMPTTARCPPRRPAAPRRRPQTRARRSSPRPPRRSTRRSTPRRPRLPRRRAPSPPPAGSRGPSSAGTTCSAPSSSASSRRVLAAGRSAGPLCWRCDHSPLWCRFPSHMRSPPRNGASSSTVAPLAHAPVSSAGRRRGGASPRRMSSLKLSQASRRSPTTRRP